MMSYFKDKSGESIIICKVGISRSIEIRPKINTNNQKESLLAETILGCFKWTWKTNLILDAKLL